MAKVDAAKLKQIANEMGYENGELILNATLELEELRNKVGRMKATIKKKQHIIDTVNHHNNRLSNDNQACKYALGAKFMEVESLRHALEEYAAKENYERVANNPDIYVGGYEQPTWEPSWIELDNGETARKALEGDSK